MTQGTSIVSVVWGLSLLLLMVLTVLVLVVLVGCVGNMEPDRGTNGRMVHGNVSGFSVSPWWWCYCCTAAAGAAAGGGGAGGAAVQLLLLFGGLTSINTPVPCLKSLKTRTEYTISDTEYDGESCFRKLLQYSSSRQQPGKKKITGCWTYL